MKEIAKVIHWYDKIGVAVVRLSGSLKVGDEVVVHQGDKEHEDTISSMQVDLKDIPSGKKGDEVAIKLSQKAKEGSVISLKD